MPITIPSMPEANAAYQAALAALRSTHDDLDAIIGAPSVDWTAYSAGLAACTSCQNAAQAALNVFQAAILDTPAVQALIVKLNADTQAMTQSAAGLNKTAATFNSLAGVANTLASILTTILKFV